MKNINYYIKEQLNIEINEAYESKAIQQMMNKLHNLDSYDTGINIYSNILKQPYFLSEKQAAKYAHLSKWKDEWFLEKNGKRLFDKKEFLSLIGLNENTKLSDINFFDIATKKSSCFFILGKRDKHNTSYLGDIECALVMDPKAGNDTTNLLKEIRKINKERSDNANTFKNPDNNLNGTWKMERANKEIKEYYKKASKEQIDLLNETVKKLMKYTNRGKNAKEEALKYKQSKNYSDEQAHITYYLIKSETGDDFLKVFSWTDNLNDNQKNYLSKVVEKLKINE